MCSTGNFCSVLCGRLGGKGVWGRTDPCICMPEAWNYHNIVHQLCFYTKWKVKNKTHKWDRENLCWWNWSRICLEHYQSEPSECNLLFLLIWGKWPKKGTEETDGQFCGPEMFPCIVAKLGDSWKQKPLWKLRRCSVDSCLLPVRFPVSFLG